MRFALVFGFFLAASWMRDNPVPLWLVVVMTVLWLMDIVEWLANCFYIQPTEDNDGE